MRWDRGPAKAVLLREGKCSAYRPAEELSGGETGILMPVSILLQNAAARRRSICRRQNLAGGRIHSVRGMRWDRGPAKAVLLREGSAAARRPAEELSGGETGILMPVSILLQNAAARRPSICRRQNLAGGRIHSARGMRWDRGSRKAVLLRGGQVWRPSTS